MSGRAEYEAAFLQRSRFCWHWKITRGEDRCWLDDGTTRTLWGARRAARRAIDWHRGIIHISGDKLVGRGGPGAPERDLKLRDAMAPEQAGASERDNARASIPPRPRPRDRDPGRGGYER